jgi:integrase
MLTDAKLRALIAATPDQRIELADGSIKGLTLRAGPRAKPTWTLRYAVAGAGGVTARGKELDGRKFFRISLGTYPTVSLREARAKASDFLAKAARGEDPIAQIEDAAKTEKDTLAELAGAFLDLHVRGRLRSAKNAEWVMREYVVPRLGQVRADRIKRADLVALLDDLARHATPTAAIETRKWLSSLFSWALEKGRMETNPILGVKAPVRSKPRERVLSLEEARAVWRAAHAEAFPSGTLVCVLMLTGARLREIANSRLSWLDRSNACFDIPGEAYKTGDPTIIPLVPEAMALLEAIPRPATGDYLLSSDGGQRPLYTVTPKALARIRSAADQDLGRPLPHWTLHDLRRTVATHMARLGVDDIVVERVLGHRIGGIKAVYNRYRYLDEKRAALALWTQELLGSPADPSHQPGSVSPARPSQESRGFARRPSSQGQT